jgi:hypothetical protein
MHIAGSEGDIVWKEGGVCGERVGEEVKYDGSCDTGDLNGHY